MTHISLSNDSYTGHRRLSFYLAMEEYVARKLKQYDECFFAWRVKPTVIFGRNQLIDSEVNLEYCRENNIDTIRRKSGGGCVYADLNNVMFSYINTGWDVCLTFNYYINKVADMLRSLGVDAQGSSRNDIMINGRKVSGNAFYHIPGRNIVHGTMLYDTNMQHMVSSITPSDKKLVSKGVQSVRQHICLLKDYIADRMTVEEFQNYACQHLCDNEYTLTNDEIKHIEEIEREYHDPSYIFGRNPGYSVQHKQRLEGIGEFDVRIDVKNNNIRHINLMGDYFLTGDLNTLLSQLEGIPYTPEAIIQAISDTKPDNVIMGLTKEKFADLIINKPNNKETK